MTEENQTVEEVVETINTGPLDVIGVLYDTPEEGEPTALPGWHVNSPWVIAAFAGKQVQPTTPRRVFGGVDTVFYTFDSEAEFLGMLKGADLSQPVDTVPKIITKRQATRALDAVGLLDKVEVMIAKSPSAVQIDWRESNTVERNWPALAPMAAALGLSDAQLDALFVAGSKL